MYQENVGDIGFWWFVQKVQRVASLAKIPQVQYQSYSLIRNFRCFGIFRDKGVPIDIHDRRPKGSSI
jgi:hypothetical protein